MSRPELEWIVFDYGEVLSYRTAAVPTLAAHVGAPVEPFELAYWDGREQYDLTINDSGYWHSIAQRSGLTVTDEQIATLTELDIVGWTDVDGDAIQLAVDIHAAGYRLALLSNAPGIYADVFAAQPWAECFEHLIVSGAHGVGKPDPEVWRILAATLDAPPASCLFLDDRAINVESARQAGLHAEQWSNPAEMRLLLKDSYGLTV